MTRPPNRRGQAARRRPLAPILLAAALLPLLPLLPPGCRARPPAPLDPALAALGRASVRVMAERLEWPPGQVPGGPVLDRPFVLHGRFEGPAAEAVLGLSGALGYGCLVEDAPAGRLPVHIEPSGGRTVLWLVRDLNRQLGARGAAIGIDAVNGRLILSGTGVGP